MKKTKLLTSIAALALVLGLGACEVNVDVGGVDVGDVDVGVDVNPNDSSEDTSEDETTSESTSENESTSESTSEGNTSESTSEGDTSENTSESGSTSESTSEPEPEPEPVDYAIVGDFTDSSWNENPATDSIYYIPAETEKYEVEVTIADQGSNTWDAGLRVVEYGTWTTAVGYTELDSASTGVWQGSKDNNIAVNWGATYDLVITLGDNPSILVTLQEEEEEEEGTGEGPDLEIAQAILDAADEADYNGLSWSAFHAEYIDESCDETKTSYLTTDSDGLYGSILDYDTGDLSFAYYYQGGLEYVYGVTGDYHEVDDSGEDYDDLLDDYTGTAIGDAFLLDVEDDDITLNELDNGYELIVNTTDMVDFKVADVEYVYITDFEYNIIGVGYGVSASGDFEGWYAEETTYDKVVTSMADFDPTLWAEEEEEETYLFGFNVNGTMYYIDGKTATNYNYEGTYTTDVNSAVRVSVEDGETAGEYYLSFDLNGTTYWITIIESSGHINLSYAETASPLYWNATYSCWGDDTLSYFLCQNSAYSCLYCSAISQYINSSPIALLYTEDGLAYTEGLVGYELPAPTKITVSGRETLYIGNTTQLSVTVEPTNANPEVTWSSSSDAIATVSDTGLVEGIADGTATITATSVKDTSVSGSIDIVVSEAPAGVTEVKLGTYDFSTKTKDFCSSNGATSVVTTTQLKTTLDTYWTSEGGYSNPLSSVTSTNFIYQYYTSGGLHPNEYNFLKTGTGSYNGTMDLSMSNTITKVEIDQQSWSTSENCTITVNNGAGQESASKGVEQTLTFDIDETTNLSMTFAKRCYIFSITLYGYVA